MEQEDTSAKQRIGATYLGVRRATLHGKALAGQRRLHHRAHWWSEWEQARGGRSRINLDELLFDGKEGRGMT